MVNKEDILFKDYELSQQSAQHHDTLVWTTTSIFSVVIGALLIELIKLYHNCNQEDVLLGMVSLFGIILSLTVLYFVVGFRCYKNKNYNHCNEIKKVILTQQSQLYEELKNKYNFELFNSNNNCKAGQWKLFVILFFLISCLFLLMFYLFTQNVILTAILFVALVFFSFLLYDEGHKNAN